MAISFQAECANCHTNRATTKHCESPTCDWNRCSTCRSVYDPVTRRGWDKDVKPLKVAPE